jgi:hypothetical protein
LLYCTLLANIIVGLPNDFTYNIYIYINLNNFIKTHIRLKFCWVSALQNSLVRFWFLLVAIPILAGKIQNSIDNFGWPVFLVSKCPIFSSWSALGINPLSWKAHVHYSLTHHWLVSSRI